MTETGPTNGSTLPNPSARHHAVIMAHYSRLSKVVIDAPAETHDAEVAFWRGAASLPLKQFQKFPEYYGAEMSAGYGMLVQRLGEGAPRVHLDIHATDVAAEVARLRELGATLVRDDGPWTVMRDPAGLVFCVVPDSDLNDDNATRWP
jgi:hypothetical protein